jgi:Tfp pilus assembly protein PilZ
MTLKTGNKIEKRQHRRLIINADVSMKKNNALFLFSAKIVNVSESGAYVVTNGPFLTGDQLDMTIYFQHDTKKLSVTVPCQVARIDGNGVGLTSPHIDANMVLQLELIFDACKENTKQLIEEYFKSISFSQKWEYPSHTPLSDLPE